MSGRRLYLGKLASDCRPDDVQKFFEGFGRITDCRVMTGFGFVEFESPKDAEDAVQQFNGKPFMGQNIVVEFAKETRPRREPYEDRPPPPRSRRPPGIRLHISGLSRETSWQDLKDFGREAGSVSFADVDRDGNGVLEYLSRDDADRAFRELRGREIRGYRVRLDYDDNRSGPDNYRRDERRDDRYRDDRYREDRHRRDRSRSPRREHDDRRARSPGRRAPPPEENKRDFDRPPAGYGRRDDDRRREERDARFDDRRPVNGEYR